MFNPIFASSEIKNSFIDYITTTFNMADKDYQAAFVSELKKEGAVSKGPFLDVGASYETGRSIDELISDSRNNISKLFSEIEPIPESERELKLYRPLYLHQEKALLKANSGENMVVTTGTGSGKTECFLLPILNHLLEQIEVNGELDAGVRAILIYPMNALANDQIKRMRKILKNYPQIKFGLYNGNTQSDQASALSEYHRTHIDENGNALEPLENEIISRDVMRTQPPHILITNYSMLEYMMLRPNDDKVFSGAKLKYIILDEAHIYKGATGMETSLLMRRLRARISEPDSVQYILTSATLGGPDENGDILRFARNLCGANFEESGIIRSKEKRPEMKEQRAYPISLFEELFAQPERVEETLKKYNADFCPNGTPEEKIYEFCLHSQLFAVLRKIAESPTSVSIIKKAFIDAGNAGLTDEQFLAIISVFAKADKDGASLIKPRYHFFARALEGAYITLSDPKQLFLTRKTSIEDIETHTTQNVFEASVCEDCGRVAISGTTKNGKLVHLASNSSEEAAEKYIIKGKNDIEFFDEDEIDETEGEEKLYDYVVCPECGAIATEADAQFEPLCDHDKSKNVRIRRAHIVRRGKCVCPACGVGNLRDFYLGMEAATGVLGTELFELLPDEEIISSPAQSVEEKKSIFARTAKKRIATKEKTRQFLCFSDSRSEAAYFATFMERSYQEFLRRRGIWNVVERLKNEGKESISVTAFVEELSRYFEINRSFAEWDQKNEEGLLSSVSKNQAWLAVINELYSARRSTGLISMGLIAFEYNINREIAEPFSEAKGMSPAEAKALFELLIQDAVFTGSIDAGEKHSFTDAEREYLFFSPAKKKLVQIKDANRAKQSWITGWAARARDGGKYYPNARLRRVTDALGISEAEANDLLMDYWENVLNAEKDEELVLDANDFTICFGGTSRVAFYKCAKCGKITPYNVKNKCAIVKCDGILAPYEPLNSIENNHYASLYRSKQAKPLYMKEHTAQLAKDKQTIYQEAFVNKKINALSCSTTFEMGVDLGSLETVYMRDVPPSPANYVQRAGRAGRAKQSAAFVLTYAKLSSHDFTYYNNPTAMICGKIKAPVFEIENRKILMRHINAVAISAFLALPENEDVYGGDNQTVLLNEDGYERFKRYLDSKPEDLRSLLIKSIPASVHETLGILDFSWVDSLCGENGTLELAVMDFRNRVKELEKAKNTAFRNQDNNANALKRQLESFRCAKEDGKRKSLIDFLVRNNVLPKYGFPVDTVELLPNMDSINSSNTLQMARDLQMAIAEYAPGSEVVADGQMYTSRYIRKLPGKNSWEFGHYCDKCPACGQPNFTKELIPSQGRECVSCKHLIPKRAWKDTLEPRRGFIAAKEVKPVPLHRPEHDYKTDDYYIGDVYKNVINSLEFKIGNQILQIESTTNDSLVVVGDSDFYVCPVCGYAGGSIPSPHNNPNGNHCINKEAKGKKYFLSHDFKTDVAKITFGTMEAKHYPTMLSVLYALLEGLSRELGIERTDIKGCLFNTGYEGTIVYSIILYDAVAGGAGHVRRIVTDNGDILQRVIRRALSVVTDCDCDSSCYKCLRNYYNQKLHDTLERELAADFLKKWVGTCEPVSKDDEVHQKKSRKTIKTDKNALTIIPSGTKLSEQSYPQIWDYIFEPVEGRNVNESVLHRSLNTIMAKHVVISEPICDCLLRNEQDGSNITADAVFEDAKVILFLSDNEEQYQIAKALVSDWVCYYTADPLLKAEDIVESIERKC